MHVQNHERVQKFCFYPFRKKLKENPAVGPPPPQHCSVLHTSSPSGFNLRKCLHAQFAGKVMTSYNSNWFTLLLLICTFAPLVLCCDRFGRGSRQVKREPVVEVDVSLCQRIGLAIFWKLYLQVPDTGTWVLDNTGPFLRPSIVSFWITPACAKERKYHIFRQYWYIRNVPVFTNTGTFQYLGPEVYFFPIFNLELVHEITDFNKIPNNQGSEEEWPNQLQIYVFMQR